MQQVEKALELLESTSEQLTNLVCGMEAGNLRGKLTAIAEEIDAFLYDCDYDYHGMDEDDAAVDDYEDNDELSTEDEEEEELEEEAA